MEPRDLLLNVYKVLGIGGFSFFLGIALAPILTHYLYKYRLWRKEVRSQAPDGAPTPIFQSLHGKKETKAPKMGGILIWATTLIVSLFFWILPFFFTQPIFSKLNFLSRGQTWVPLGTLLAGAIVGLIDDFFVVFQKGGYKGGGITFTRRVLFIFFLGFLVAYWFYFKLERTGIFVPGVGEWELGFLFIPFFILVILGTFSGGVIDGLDGLAGGVLASVFGAYSGIAFFQNQIDIATFCAVIVGAILAFLWFNIPPARFYMSETGIMGLTTTLAVVAFLTDAVVVLPLIAFPLVVDALSVVIQLGSKKYFKRKVFLIAPLHHHFEALGWTAEKVTMRVWVIAIIFSLVGMIIHLISIHP